MNTFDTSARRPYDNALVPPSKPAKTTAGLTWKAFKGNYAWLPDVSTLTPVASGNSTLPDVSKVKSPAANIFLFQGYIDVPQDGSYTFNLRSAGKAFIRLHEAALIDADFGYQPGATRESTMNLKAGLHAIRIYYMGKANPDALKLKWQGPSIAKAVIPASAYKH